MAFDIPWQSFLAIKRATVGIFYLFLLAAQSHAATGPLSVRLETVPPIDDLIPQSEPSRLVLTILDSEFRPFPSGRVRILLHAPEPGWIFPTDLPAVEGSRLIDMELPVADGVVDWEYIFPIRGVYQMEVTVLDETGERGQRQFTLSVKESREKLFYLASFSVLLFLLGFCMGWWLHRTRRRTLRQGELLLLGVSGLFPLTTATAQDAKIGGEIAIDAAVVGKLTHIAWHIPEHSGPALLTLTVTDLENERRVLFLSRVPTQGKFALDFQFTDGARYRVTALAEMEGKEALRQVRLVTVKGADPPQGPALASWSFFLGLVFLGMVTGHRSRKNRRMRMRLR